MNWSSGILPRSFYARSSVEVAQDLLGKYLVSRSGSSLLVGRIVETEAYLPSGDSAAHNFKGKTKRNASLYKDAGNAYVHSMRQYCLIDIVTDGVDEPGSVLIRAVEPVEGVEKMMSFRNEDRLENLTNGPGKVCMALGISRALDGTDVTSSLGGLFVVEKEIQPLQIGKSARIGISSAKEAELRYFVADSPYLSKRG